MKLHFAKDWLRRRLEKLGEAGIDDPPCGLMACSPEIYAEMMNMTTKVKIELVDAHQPIVVEVAGREVAMLMKSGESHTDYVHSSQQIVVREPRGDELYERGVSAPSLKSSLRDTRGAN